MKYELRTELSVEVEFDNLHNAIHWVREHTVFDLLDRGAVQGSIFIYDENCDLLVEI